MEEKRVIEGKETARNLGEINEDEMSRDSHGAVPFTAVSPISNEPINKK